jgi:hypothetical protein
MSKAVGYVRYLRFSEVQEYRCPDCVRDPDSLLSPWSPLSANEVQDVVCDECHADLVPSEG